MGVKKVLKKGLFSGFSVTRWVGLDNIKDNGRVIAHLAKSLFKKSENQSVSTETFEQLMQKMQWSEKDLKQGIKQGFYLVLFCLACSVAIFCYMLYLVHLGQILPSFVCFILSLLLLAHAFREHITLFRLKKRKLDSTVK